jgi:RNA 3'-terminal phosphate cyclase
MALSSGASSFRTLEPSLHLSTQIETVRLFLEREITVTNEGKGVHRLAVSVTS